MKKLFAILSIALFSYIGSLYAQSPGSGSMLYLGTSNHIDVTNSASINMTTAITVEAWIEPMSWDPNSWGGSIVSKEMWNSTNEYGYVLRCGDNGKLSFNIGTTNNWKEVVSASIMPLNKWSHVVGTYDGSFLKIYINGDLVGTTAYSGSINVDNTNLRIGAAVNTTGGVRHYHGSIDEVRLWNIALSQNTIKTWMCRKVTSSHPNYTNLKAYWRLDEGSGITTVDHSMHNNTGILVSNPTWFTSSAPIGDTSSFIYSSPFNLSLAGINQDTLSISNVSLTPSSIHIYRVDDLSNAISIPASNTGIDSSHYWGIAVFGSPNSLYTATLQYGNIFTNSCKSVDLLFRLNNSTTSLANSSATLNTSNTTLTQTFSGNKELIIGFTNLNINIATIATSDTTTFCDGDSAILSGPASSMFTYQWLLNNSPISGEIGPEYSAKSSGNYSVIVSAGVCSDTSQIITIIENPKPLTPINSLIAGDSLWSSATYGNQWHDSAGAISGAANQTYKPTHYGVHYVIMTDSNGCVSDTSNIIDYGVGVAENDLGNERLIIYPNPNNGNFSILIEQNIKVEITIYNLNGQEISNYKINENQSGKLLNHKLNSGIYIVKANFKNKVIVQKVVVY